MLKKVVILFLVVFLVSCTRTQEQTQKDLTPETEQPIIIAPERPAQEPTVQPEQQAQEPQPIKTENSILILKGDFQPSTIAIIKGESVVWEASAEGKFYKISCYESGTHGTQSRRIFISEQIDPGMTYTYTFTETGEYLCIEPVYGARGTVQVKGTPMELVTGNVVTSVSTKSTTGAALIILTVLIIFTGMNIRKKR